MKRALGGIALAIVLFAAAMACRAEARLTRASAEAQRRLATLHFDAPDATAEADSFWTRVPWLTGASADGAQRQRATVDYWRMQYQALGDLAAKGPGAAVDAQTLLVAANASYRSAVAASDRRTVVTRLDAVVQSYATVLRQDPNNLDAAYNYEYVSRYRDAHANANARGAQALKRNEQPPDVSADLPPGPTIHGLPGAPPPGTNMSEFKTIAPMLDQERKESIEADQGHERKRKG